MSHVYTATTYITLDKVITPAVLSRDSPFVGFCRKSLMFSSMSACSVSGLYALGATSGQLTEAHTMQACRRGSAGYPCNKNNNNNHNNNKIVSVYCRFKKDQSNDQPSLCTMMVFLDQFSYDHPPSVTREKQQQQQHKTNNNNKQQQNACTLV